MGISYAECGQRTNLVSAGPNEPLAPRVDDVWMNTQTQTWMIYDGANWVAIPAPPAPPANSVTVDDTNFTKIVGADVQAALESVDGLLP